MKNKNNTHIDKLQTFKHVNTNYKSLLIEIHVKWESLIQLPNGRMFFFLNKYVVQT